MKITEDLLKNILDMTEQVIVNAVNAIYSYQKKSSYIPKYYKFPSEFLEGLKETENYDEIKNNVPAFKYGIPFYSFTQYNTPLNYGELLSSQDGQFNINCHGLDGFDTLLGMFLENEELYKMLASEEKYIKSSLISYISNITNRYLYETQKFKEGEIDSQFIRELIIKQLIRLYSKRLNLTICVPICFLEFESDEIAITDRISISKMSSEFQISRFNASHFESTQENNLIQCANFMIRMSGYSIENKDRESLHNAISNYWSFPTEIIDDLFAAIRIAVGLRTGYGQLLIEPNEWAEKWSADLIPIYGTSIRSFNRNEVDTKFFGYEIGMVTNSNIQDIQELFTIIREKRADEKKNKSFKKVFIAIQRLNRCMLREADDDMALDAIIGIETLLSGDTHGEITYTISNRITVVATKVKECPYSPADARRAMKTIYGLRSDIVHGRETNKNSKVKIVEEEIDTKKLAIDFLRYSLLFIIRNQEYLEVKEFEKALDNAIDTVAKKDESIGGKV
ncbi:HEPN domain-containing protein [Clostridium magnum]|uniref:HEPN domain-containing protein n=1 Tax=Clostridium magnum TaxID=33954 RepID=UPI00090F62E7|nr:HEPN domain-containing protein [Clostridium magnum]SHH77204.1 hypothetical protein SAMN02745944_01402 [Clostridium magnum DSM 2767]